MKFTVKVPGMTLYPGGVKHWWEHIKPEEIIRIAQRIEELGYDYIEISEHIVMNRESAAEMGSRWVHSLGAASFIFGATKTVRVMPLIVVPYHQPIELAKLISTLDFLSGGRVVPLMLLGYKRYEYDLLSVPYEPRGSIMNEYIESMIELWESDNPTFKGEYVELDDIVFDPKPVQQPIPMHFGGAAPAALRRVARWGHGWNTSSWTPRSEFRKRVQYIQSQPEFQANPRPLELSLGIFEGKRDLQTHAVIEQPKIVMERDAVLEQLHQIAALGATYTDANDLLGIGRFQNAQPDAPEAVGSVEQFLERLDWFAQEILPEARKIETTAIVAA
jgi:alkanesulfonate monooxygenase SsuD/methylene tetrahydromethanopterin reductase-like flavin-dependent oxidoreductase (luciferase family)